MNEFKGTLGPWKVTHSESKTAWNIIGTRLGGKYKIARCPYEYMSDMSQEYNTRERTEALANVQLISKAPEMLAMLQDIKGYLGSDKRAEVEGLIKQATTI